jgi:hypothetical protein
MSFTNVTPIINPTVTTKTFTLVPSTAGDFILFGVLCSSTTTSWATALTSAGGNVTWSALGTHLASTVNTATTAYFIGQVVTASSHTVTVTTNTGSPAMRAAGSEFSNTSGFAAVTLDASANVDVASAGSFPSVTPSQAGDLYWSYVFDNGTGTAGSTSGFTYRIDANGNPLCYNTSCTSSAQHPNIGDTGDGTSGTGFMFLESGTTVNAGLAHGTGAALQPQAGTTGLAHGTGTAQPPVPQVTALAGLAHGAGGAFVPSFGASAQLAPGTGAALQPAVQVTVFAGLAHASGTAFQIPAQAGLAHATGTAQPPHLLVSPVARLASGAGTVYQPTPHILRNPLNLGAVLSETTPSAVMTLVPYGATFTLADYGATLGLSDFGAQLTGWTMLTAPLNLNEFNDVTINIAVTENGSPYNLTGVTLNLLLKTVAGTPDANALIFSSSGGSPAIVVTNASGGLATAVIPNTDLDAETYNFYRLDVVSGGLTNTTLYGNITWTTL